MSDQRTIRGMRHAW